MNAPLDEAYFTWLYSQVASTRLTNPSKTFWSLLRQLYKKEFVWFVPNDDNRGEDGQYLRYEFLETRDIKDVDSRWFSLGCSMLEMLVALSRRLSFEADGEPRDWFWHLLDNIGLARINDRIYSDSLQKEVDEILDRVIWRTYSPNGEGGLFPLHDPPQDQRKVELWYQLSAYLVFKH